MNLRFRLSTLCLLVLIAALGITLVIEARRFHEQESYKHQVYPG
jgi:hypothetical protein